MTIKQRYKVEETLLPNDDGVYEKRWFITAEYIPVYEINAFLEEKSLVKITTGRKYAYSLVKYLNYLDVIGCHYKEATIVNVRNYLKWLMYGDNEDLTIHSLKSKISHSTLSGDITVVTEFYKHLLDEHTPVSMQLKEEKRRNKKSFYYGQIFEYDYSKIINKHIKNLKPSKEYIKWYDESEKEALLSNFKTLRDKAMFLLLLEGMRIDEVLSVRLSEFDDIDQTVQPSRSKGKETVVGEDNSLRAIALPLNTVHMLNDYLLNERPDAETESGIFNDYLFINLRKGVNQGEPVSYHNFLKLLKSAAYRAGIDPRKIRTHSGRSTKVNELLEHQALHPEDNITDFMIKEIMGWSSIDSIEAYKNHSNKMIAKTASEKVNRRREMDDR